MKRIILPAVLAGLLSGPVFAGPIADFNDAYQGMYARYRAALFQTNAGTADVAEKALQGFAGSWGKFVTAYGQTPPPHLVEDTGWSITITEVGKSLAVAQDEVAEGKLAEAHETLEHVRDIFSDMHARNGIVSFSDRMNAYHAEMEHLLGMDLSNGVDAGLLRERAAVLKYLADDLVAHPPVAADAMYAALAKDFVTSVEAFLAATRSGEPAAIKASMKGLKKPYAKLFVKFG